VGLQEAQALNVTVSDNTNFSLSSFFAATVAGLIVGAGIGAGVGTKNRDAFIREQMFPLSVIPAQTEPAPSADA
jgi:hypothetical protein